MTMDTLTPLQRRILELANPAPAAKPEITYVGRLAYRVAPDGTRTRVPEADLPLEESTALVAPTGSTAGPKAPQGALSAAEVAGFPEIGPGLRKGPTGWNVRRNPDGTWDYEKATAAADSGTRKATPLEIGAQALGNFGRATTPQPAQPASSMQEAGAAVSPSAPSIPAGGSGILRDFYGTPTTARVNYGAGGIQDIPLNSSNTRQDLALFGLTPSGKPETDAMTALASRAWIADKLSKGIAGPELSAMLDIYRDPNKLRGNRLTAGDLSAILEPEKVPADWNLPVEEELPLMAHGGSVTTGTPPYTGTLYKTDGGRMVPPWELKPSEYNRDAKDYSSGRFGDNPYKAGMPWAEWFKDYGVLPGKGYMSSRQFGTEGDRSDVRQTLSNIRTLNGRLYGTSPDGTSWSRSIYGEQWEPVLPGDQWGRQTRPDEGGDIDRYAQGFQRFTPDRFANGGSIMLGVDEPVIGMGAISREPKFIAGEAGPERMDITPVGKPSAPPEPQPNQRLDVMLAGLRELSRGVSRRRQALQIPVGAMS